MEETNQPQSDQDPAPIKHSDAERVTGKEADAGREPEQPEDERAGTEADSDHG